MSGYAGGSVECPKCGDSLGDESVVLTSDSDPEPNRLVHRKCVEQDVPEPEIDDSAAEKHPDVRSGMHNSTEVGR